MFNKIPSSSIKTASGFTLLEVLVVLVLLSMVMTMLMQGLSMVFNLRSRILVQINEQRVNRLRSSFFYDLISGLTPDDPKADAVFSGDDKGFYGLSLQSLQGATGMPVQVRLWTDQQEEWHRLLYKQQGYDEVELGRWYRTAITFTYFDEAGERYDHWPERNSSMPQMPSAITIQVGEVDVRSAWFVPVLGRTEPRSNVQEIFE